MSAPGRLVKDPNRVRPILQRLDPVGTTAGPRHIVGIGDKAAMPKISKTGIYQDRVGNRFYYEEGTPVTDEQHKALRFAGERQRPNEERALPAAPENKSLPRAPQTKAVGGEKGE